jgi:hypothetical protein
MSVRAPKKKKISGDRAEDTSDSVAPASPQVAAPKKAKKESKQKHKEASEVIFHDFDCLV